MDMAHKWLIFAMLFMPLFSGLHGKKETLAEDEAALLAFKAGITEDPNGALQNWVSGTNSCEWNGVKCSLDDSLGNRVVGLELSSFGLKGSVSAHLGKISHLQYLILSDNAFSGDLAALFKAPFHWQLPGFSAHPTAFPALEILDLSHNQLSGSIPQEISSCANLLWLNLGDNRIAGQIPETIGDLALEELDVSNNYLVGAIPAGISRIRSVNVARNQLEGSIPYMKFVQQRRFYEGNPGLCGLPLSSPCIASSPSQFHPLRNQIYDLFSKLVHFRRTTPATWTAPIARSRRWMAENTAPSPDLSPALAPTSSPSHKHNKRWSAFKKWGIGGGLGIATGLLLGLLLGGIYRLGIYIRNRSKKPEGPRVFHRKLQPKMLEFLEKDGALEDKELIGQGGFGQVYKAKLENGLVVAVKRIMIQDEIETPSHGSTPSRRSKNQELPEVDILGQIRHMNLVPLYGYLKRPDAHLLVYKYMEHGSISDALQKVRDGTLELKWDVRHKIVKGIATGLSYLHNDCETPIIHRDLKPSNILIDEDFDPHLSDFGIARTLPQDKTHGTTTCPAGTFGYMAPEYYQTCKYTTSSDVFSLGVVIFVILSGKEPSDPNFSGLSIVDHMGILVQEGRELEGIDPTLHGDEMDKARMKLTMRIACFCTRVDPAKRPTSQEVCLMLAEEPKFAH